MPGAEVVEASPTHSSLRYIPAGSFWMGSPAGEIAQQDGEDYHQVTLTRSFLMMTTEVTKAEWRRVADGNPNFNPTPSSFANCPACPVDNVNWFAAAAFANELSRLENLGVCYVLNRCGNGNFGTRRTCAHPDPIDLNCTGYRLPTEAEWEYAARAGNQGPRYGELIHIAWFSGNARERPHQVGHRQPNAWGLHDMLGNLSEWTGDWSGDYNLQEPVDPMGPRPMLAQQTRMHRGGAWTSAAPNVRAAFRAQRDVSDGAAFLGFRLVRSLPPPEN